MVAATLATTAAGLALASPASAATNANWSKGILTISGDNAANSIVVSRDAAGHLKVNGGAVKIRGGQATTNNTTRVQVFGSGGADTVTFDEAQRPAASRRRVRGRGQRHHRGRFEGGHAVGPGRRRPDRLERPGRQRPGRGRRGHRHDRGARRQHRRDLRPHRQRHPRAARPHCGRPRRSSTSAPPSTFLLRAGGGDDTFSAVGNLAALIATTAYGEAGKDTLLGTNGADVLDGGDDADFVDGQQGNDSVVLGAGDDAFAWDPGDGNDTVDGGTGSDSSRVNGSNGNENMAVSANGAGARFTRDLGSVVTDLTRVEKLRIGTSGGTDNVVVNDVSGSGLTDVDLDLSAAIGGGDAMADVVTVTGTPGADSLELTSDATSRVVSGLPARVSVAGFEASTDRLGVQGGDGQDVLALRGSVGDDVLDVAASDGAALLVVNGGVTGRRPSSASSLARSAVPTASRWATSRAAR